MITSFKVGDRVTVWPLPWQSGLIAGRPELDRQPATVICAEPYVVDVSDPECDLPAIFQGLTAGYEVTWDDFLVSAHVFGEQLRQREWEACSDGIGEINQWAAARRHRIERGQ
jgi:hypothetical protein